MSGVLILSHISGHLGTFCQDGSFTLPVGQPLILRLDDIPIIVKYGYNHYSDVNLNFNYNFKYLNAQIGLIKSFQTSRHTIRHIVSAFINPLPTFTIDEMGSNILGSGPFNKHIVGMFFHSYRFKPFVLSINISFPYIMYMKSVDGVCRGNLTWTIINRAMDCAGDSDEGHITTMYLRCGQYVSYSKEMNNNKKSKCVRLHINIELDQSWPHMIVVFDSRFSLAPACRTTVELNDLDIQYKDDHYVVNLPPWCGTFQDITPRGELRVIFTVPLLSKH